MSLPAENIHQIDGPVSRVPVAQSETAAVLGMIERAARDPAVDIDKLSRLMEMREKIERETSKRAFSTALRAAQSEMRPIAANALNPQTKSKYATYAKLDGELRPIYTRHGFALSFDEADSPKPEHIRVLCYVSHDGGFERTYHKDMPVDGKGAKGGDVMSKTHASGAASSYGARYLLKGIFNVAVGEDDRDGNKPAEAPEPPPGSISPEQVDEIRRQLNVKGCSERAFLQHVKHKSVESIPDEMFEICLDVISSFRRK